MIKLKRISFVALRVLVTVTIHYLVFTSTASFAQTNQQPPPQQPTGAGVIGVTTGEARTYATRRTTNIVDAQAPVVFEDITARTALANFRHVSGAPDKNYIIETVSGGVALLDYDNDQRLDIYLVNGSTMAVLNGRERAPRAVLYRNLGNMRFADVTEQAGVANERWGMGVACADYDSDGDTDMYVGNYGVSRLYRNNGDGTFTDVAERYGVARKGWSTGASFGDYDQDGRLDLFVPGYVSFDINKLPPSPADALKPGAVGQNLCQFRGVAVMCGPRGLLGEGDTLYHQKPDGTFEDASLKSGVQDKERYYGFSSAFVHVNNDKLLDLLVVNDSTPKQLYINKGDGTFEEAGYPSGIALNENGREQAGMGLGVGDYDNDGLTDFYITNFSDDSDTVYHNDGEGNFTDVTAQSGISEPTIPFLGWGASFIDYNNDGWRDLIVANGHVYPGVDQHQWGTSYAQQVLLFHNLGAKKSFARVGAAPGSGLSISIPARGLAVGDLDEDGREDVVINNIDSKPTLLRNVTAATGKWLTIKLVGDAAKRVSRDAIGTAVFVTTRAADGSLLRQRQDVVSGGGYSSQNDLRLHFGLGAAARIEKISVQWADGTTETINDVKPMNCVVTIAQGKSIIASQVVKPIR